MPDIVELILAEHARIQELFGKLADAAGAAGELRADRLGKAWAVLARLVEVHVDTAQEISCPALFLGTARRYRAEIAADHDDIREALGETRFQPTGSAVWWLAVRAARTAAIRHIDVIESGPLAAFLREASPGERDVLGAQWLSFQTAMAEDGERRGIGDRPEGGSATALRPPHVFPLPV